MHRSDCMYYLLFFLLFLSLACIALTSTVNMTCTDTEFIDLGFNGETEDKCDYLDYSELDSSTDYDQRKLTVLQLNIRGLLNKQF